MYKNITRVIFMLPLFTCSQLTNLVSSTYPPTVGHVMYGLVVTTLHADELYYIAVVHSSI